MNKNTRNITLNKHKKLQKKRLTRTKKTLNIRKHEINEYKVTKDMRNAVKLNAQQFKQTSPPAWDGQTAETAQRVLKHSA